MGICASTFRNYLDQGNIKYSTVDSNNIAIIFSGKNCSTIRILFSFGDENRDVAVCIPSIVSVGQKVDVGHAICNTLNSSIRWLRFYIDRDNEIAAEGDAIISPDTAGEVCTIFMMKAVEIVDTVYPIIMQSLWSL